VFAAWLLVTQADCRFADSPVTLFAHLPLICGAAVLAAATQGGTPAPQTTAN
jgi:hypothetical protein